MLHQLLVALCCVSATWAFPNGAPAEACLRGMTPNHGGVASLDPRTMPFRVTRQTYRDEVRVTIQSTGDAYFKGFMIQARDPRTGQSARGQGKWQQVDNVKHLPECASVTHADRSEKASVTVTWTGREDVSMRVTVLESYARFWADLEAVEESQAPSPPPQRPRPGPQPVAPSPFAPVVDQSRFDPQRFFPQRV